MITKKPITLNSTEDLIEIVIENQTRDNLVRFNVDFGRVMVGICIKKCERRREMKPENMIENSLKPTPIYRRTTAMSIREEI